MIRMNERRTSSPTSSSELFDDIQKLLSTSRGSAHCGVGQTLTRGTVVCCHAPHCGSECRFQHSPLPVRYATVQSPFRCVSSPPLPSDQPSSSRFSARCVASLTVLRGQPTSWPPVLESSSSISATSLQRTRIWSTSLKSFPLGTSANTCARLNGCDSVNSRQLSARLLSGSRSEEFKV